MRLKQYDSWGSKYYAEDGKGLTSGGFADSGLGFKFKNGELVTVTWPDGAVQRRRLVSRPLRIGISDMGNNYTVDTLEWGFNVKHHGVIVWIHITEVDVELLHRH